MTEKDNANHQIEWIFFDTLGVLFDNTNHEQKKIDEVHHTIRIFDSRITRQQIVDSIPKASIISGKLEDNLLGLFITDSHKLHMARNLMAGKIQAMSESSNKVRPEAKVILSSLAKKYHLCLIADNSEIDPRELEIAELYDFVQFSGELGLAKPDVRYFMAMLGQHNVEAFSSAIVADNIERVLLPAKRIGITTVWFKKTSREDAPLGQIDFTIENLNQLLEIF